MNILYIHEDRIDLIGFDELKEKAYFVFRSSGLVISPIKVSEVQTSYDIYEKSIKDKALIERLIKCHSFTKGPDNTYYSLYPNLKN